jgi:aminopeptidase N
VKAALAIRTVAQISVQVGSSRFPNGLKVKTKAIINKGATQFCISLFFALFLFGSAAAQRRERVVDNWRPTHYDVSISFNDQLRELTSARTEIRLTVLKDNVNAIDLDFGGMPIDSVTLDGQPARFERQSDLLNVFLSQVAKNGDKLSIIVAYHGRPKDGLILTTDRDGKPSATGDNWPNRVHQWIPCLDHPSAKATVTFNVSAPSRDVVVANGKFVGGGGPGAPGAAPQALPNVTMTRNGGAPTLWKFDETKAIPAYCMVIAVSEGARIDADEKTVTPLSYYVPRRDSSYAAKGFSAAAPALAFFSETVGPYPYEKLALIVGATKYGGMENSSAIVFTNNLFDVRSSEKMSARFGIPTRIESVVAHEIAHQWFGDSVTESTWADLWLSEGFATYFAGLFIEKYDGEDAFREYMRSAASRYFGYEGRHNAPIHDTTTENLNDLLNPNNYEKGAWVLHMLRKRLGDEAFFKGLRIYYEKHRDANATTEDLREALEKASAQNLKEFFARWVYGSGHPKYELSSYSAEYSGAGESVGITLKQTQAGEVFLDPVPIEITTAKGNMKRYVITPRGKTETLQLHFDTFDTFRSVKLDPNETLLKEANK